MSSFKLVPLEPVYWEYRTLAAGEWTGWMLLKDERAGKSQRLELMDMLEKHGTEYEIRPLYLRPQPAPDVEQREYITPDRAPENDNETTYGEAYADGWNAAVMRSQQEAGQWELAAEYPPCDYCGITPDHHPWHGSGIFKGKDDPHIHACSDCRHKLPAPDAAQLVEALESAYHLIDNHSGETLPISHASDQMGMIDDALATYRKGE